MGEPDDEFPEDVPPLPLDAPPDEARPPLEEAPAEEDAPPEDAPVVEDDDDAPELLCTELLPDEVLPPDDELLPPPDELLPPDALLSRALQAASAQTPQSAASFMNVAALMKASWTDKRDAARRGDVDTELVAQCVCR